MSGKRHDRKAQSPPAELNGRAEKARREGRYQQALDLAKQLYKAQPTPPHRELLKQIYLERGRQQRSQGALREAATTFEAGASVEKTNRAWLETLAGEIIACGEPGRALALLGSSPNQPPPASLLTGIADVSIAGDERAALPQELVADRDRIRLAFAQLEKGDDEGVKATLQGIGLRSPYMEWKVLLRGLQAYYQNDDARALDNWQRLTPDRTPARLAAPFRANVDPTFAAAQPAQTQGLLKQQFERLQGSGLVPGLSALRSGLAHPEENLAPAFRQAEALVPSLRQQAPDLAARLATCFYWAIIQTGPEDVLRYQRVFGAPSDDPHFNRLKALANDRYHNSTEAHHHWHLYEQEIAAHPETWGSKATLARALIWFHMGEIARNIPTEAQAKRLPKELRDHPARPKPLDPSAETCFKKSLELVPNLLDAHEGLFHHLRDDLEQPAKAEKAARALLEHFPNHIDTLRALATLRREKDADGEALELLERALAHNPLDRDLRNDVGRAHLRVARENTLKNKFDGAREHLQSAQALLMPAYQIWAACQASANEQKAGVPAKAEELRQQALKLSGHPTEVAYLLLTEAARLKLPAAIKKGYEKEFTAGLAKPDGAVAAALARHLGLFQREGVEYSGLKTHTNKILAYVTKVSTLDLPEEMLLTLCRTLSLLGARPRAFKSLILTARGKCPENPEFLILDLGYQLEHHPEQIHIYSATHTLEEASRLIGKLPSGNHKEALQEQVKTLREHLEALNPFGGPLSELMNLFGQMAGMDFGDIFGDEDDEDDWDD